MNDDNVGLIIFVKSPKLGKVKTRIAKTVGDEIALDIYKKLLTHTRIVAEAYSSDRFLYYAFEINYDDEWSKQKFDKRMQIEGNLGDKMKQAFEDVLKTESKAIIIGSDCGELASADIELAEKYLDDYDVVIGPAKDGGYYLLGMKTCHKALFDDMPWSQDFLLMETISVCKKIGLSYILMEEKSDVDYYEDWLKVKDLVLS